MIIDRINELYAGQIFGRETQLAARDRIQWICKQARGEKILDIGCSQGITSLLLGREGFDCTGVDYKQAAIDYALTELAKEEELTRNRVRFQVADATSLPFDDNSFDTVILGEILEHLTHPSKVLKEAERVLKDGGIALISVPFGLNPDPDHKSTYYPVSFLKDVQPFFRTEVLDTLQNYILYSGKKDKGYDIKNISQEEILREYLELQKKVEERCLVKEQAIYDLTGKYTEQTKKLNEQVQTLSKSNKELQLALENKEKELKLNDEKLQKVISEKENELNALRADFDRKKQQHVEDVEKTKELHVDLLNKKGELNGNLLTRLDEMTNVLIERDKQLKKVLEENEGLKRQLKATGPQFQYALSNQEALFKHAWKWRIGSIFVEGYILARDFVKQPIFFIREADKRFKEFYHSINPGALPEVKKEQQLRKDMVESVRAGAPVTAPQPQKKAVVKRAAGSGIALGCVLDEFTAACFSPECDLVAPRPDNWKDVFEKNPPNGIFVESAWKGNEGSWQYRIAKYSKNMGDELLHLLAWAREKKIPSFFWNKEDPTHFERFVDRAKLFDHVFTTDADCIPGYKKEVGHDRVYALPFAAQPLIHSPILEHPREHVICFAGTYYAMFPERCQDMEIILKPALDFDLHIYDRQYGLSGSEAAQYRFPDIYHSAIKGRLDYKDMLDAYKNYRVFLNVNSVKDSPTMFSRRVFELLACGTPVISTYSKGIEELLGRDLVLITESENDTRQYLEKLIHDHDYWSALSLKGIRKVMEEHTYSHRMKFISDRVGLNYSALPLSSFSVVSIIENERDLDRLRESLMRQKYRNFDVVLLTKGDLGDALQRIRNAMPDISIMTFSLRSATSYSDSLKACRGEFVTVFDCKDYYGANYLRDYALTSQYAQADYIGKNSYIFYKNGVLRYSGNEFRFVEEVPTATLAIKKEIINKDYFPTLLDKPVFKTRENKILSLDRFNYIKCTDPGLSEDGKKVTEI